MITHNSQFNNNCHRDAWLIALGNSLTSIYAGFIVFGTLGVLAEVRLRLTEAGEDILT